DDASAQRRVAERDARAVQAFEDDEVPVSLVVDERDGRHSDPGELVERDLDAVGDIAGVLEIALHVEQREALAPDLRLIARRVHPLEDLDLVDRLPVVVGEQRRDRGGPAAEIVLLVQRRAEGDLMTDLLDRAHRHREGAAGGAEEGRGALGERGWRRGRPQQRSRARGRAGNCAKHGGSYCICRFRIVEFWMTTVLPEFWTTIGIPLIEENESPLIELLPVVRLVALLSVTIALALFSFRCRSAPPRWCDNSLAPTTIPLAHSVGAGDGAGCSADARVSSGAPSPSAAVADMGSRTAAVAIVARNGRSMQDI